MLFKKLLLSYISLIVIPLSILSITITNITAKTINEEINKSASIILDEASQNLSNILDNLKGAALLVSRNDTIQKDLSKTPRNTKELNDQLNEMRTAIINNGIYNQIYSSIQLYALNNYDYSPFNNTNDIMSYKFVQNEPWFKETINRKGKLYWSVSSQFGATQISVSRVIYDFKDPTRILAVVSVGVKLSQIEMMLSKIKIGKTGMVFIIDEKNNPIYPHNIKLGLPKKLSLNRDSETKQLNINGKATILFSNSLSETTWKVISLISIDDLFEKTNSLKKIIYIMVVLSIIIAIFMSFLLSLNISRPIIKLAKIMKTVKDGELALPAETSCKGEIEILYNSFNYMIQMIKSLIQDVYITKIKQKDAEFKALKAQINPHFLYNTLDAINWMAMKYKATDINKMVTSLASLLRYSINGGENVIELDKELKQVESYLTIQKIRYYNKFEVYFNVDQEILDCKVVKLILQPLVENAIIHGIENVNQPCYIIINGYRKDSEIVLEIINNGIPIDLDKINAIITNDEEYKGHGIRNVNQRIKLTYGENFGIHYRLEGCESIAVITLPFIQ
jgi:two-component system sensor histidine kinase YesM